MSPSSARQAGTARVAIVGAATPTGSRLREALAACGFPGARLELYGTTRGEVVLSEYDGEARLIQEPEPEAIADRDLIFLCETGPAALGVGRAAAPSTALIDLARAEIPNRRRRLVHTAPKPDGADDRGQTLVVPQALSALLVDLLGPVERAAGIEEATAVIARPASDFGDEGLEELREQTVGLLNFAGSPRRVFGRQLAFNVLPQFATDTARFVEESVVTDEVRELLSWEKPRLALRLLTVPVFYGHGLQVRVRCGRSVTRDALHEALAQNGVHVGDDERPAMLSPLEASVGRETVVADLSADGLGGFWIWAVAGEAEARRAELAVRLAQAVCDL